MTARETLDEAWLTRAVNCADDPAAQRDVAALNVALFRLGMPSVALLLEIPSAQHALAADVAKTFGTTVRFVSAHAGFEGVSHNGVAYLTPKMKYPALAIAGHEVFHTMEQTDPVAAEKLLDHIQQYLHPDAVERRQQWEQIRSQKEVTARHALGEVVADLHGAMWLSPTFWRELASLETDESRKFRLRYLRNATCGAPSLAGTRLSPRSLSVDVSAVRALFIDSWRAVWCTK